MQPTAVDGDLRRRVAREDPARLLPDDLAEAVEVAQLPRADRDRLQPRHGADGVELGHRVRRQVDAHAELAHLMGCLKHGAGHAALLQHEREGEPADPAARDEDHSAARVSGAAACGAWLAGRALRRRSMSSSLSRAAWRNRASLPQPYCTGAATSVTP